MHLGCKDCSLCKFVSIDMHDREHCRYSTAVKPNLYMSLCSFFIRWVPWSESICKSARLGWVKEARRVEITFWFRACMMLARAARHVTRIQLCTDAQSPCMPMRYRHGYHVTTASHLWWNLLQSSANLLWQWPISLRIYKHIACAIKHQLFQQWFKSCTHTTIYVSMLRLWPSLHVPEQWPHASWCMRFTGLKGLLPIDTSIHSHLGPQNHERSSQRLHHLQFVEIQSGLGPEWARGS